MLMMMLFLGASLASAQENRVYWGPKVGVNISAITKSGFSSWKGELMSVYLQCIVIMII